MMIFCPCFISELNPPQNLHGFCCKEDFFSLKSHGFALPHRWWSSQNQHWHQGIMDMEKTQEFHPSPVMILMLNTHQITSFSYHIRVCTDRDLLLVLFLESISILAHFVWVGNTKPMVRPLIVWFEK